MLIAHAHQKHLPPWTALAPIGHRSVSEFSDKQSLAEVKMKTKRFSFFSRYCPNNIHPRKKKCLFFLSKLAFVIWKQV